jgi:hypothetical protein
LIGVPDDTFAAEPVYSGGIITIRNLNDGYLENTASLKVANNKLKTLCLAAKRCEGPQ